MALPNLRTIQIAELGPMLARSILPHRRRPVPMVSLDPGFRLPFAGKTMRGHCIEIIRVHSER
jgi:hypothetical protein